MKNQAPNFMPGMKWLGKWNKNPYRVIKKLGNGATGSVYLAETQHGQAAVKIGGNKASLTSEVNVLKHFSQVRGNVLGPSLLDVDDIEVNGEVYPFFCMEYLKGEFILDFLSRKGKEWAPVLLVQLLGDLDRLHREGWIFGDLKPENLMVTGPPPRVRWFDVGGTTKLGRGIKEYTEFYDRGYWGLGDRKAEPSYDLFAAAMIFIQTAYPKRFDRPAASSFEFLVRKIDSAPALAPFRKILVSALKGHYSNAQLMRRDVMDAIERKQQKQPRQSKEPVSVRSNTHVRQRVRPTKNKKIKEASYKLEIILTASFLLLSSVLYFMGQWL
ncbi:protein kinase family protein [Alteribacillus sp. HJP-4]|uniref:protein kinase domain-containing protein n=1 Tax=Alteribacillus sp. HJP-4 TaxID=2775394 RepID=UPI0035CD3BBE